MKKCYKKYLAAVLSAAFVLSMSACGGSSGGNTPATAANTAAATTAAAKTATTAAKTATTAAVKTATTAAAGAATTTAAGGSSQPSANDPTAPYPSPVTITYGVSTDPSQQFNNNDTYADNVWTRYIKQKLNIDCQIAFSADGNAGNGSGVSAYDQKMLALLASDDLPDIMFTYNSNFFSQAVEAGYLADIGPLLDQWSTPSLKAYQTKYPESFQSGQSKGTQYGYPVMSDNFYSPNFLWIRQDWLKNTNSQPPKTVDDFINLVKTFTNGNPNGDGSKTYGFAMTNSPADNMQCLMYAYGVPGSTFYRGAAGKVTFGLLQPQAKTVLGILRDMYAAGEIDPEFPTKDMNGLETDITNNVVGMFDYQNWGTWYPFNLSYQATKVITHAYPYMTVPNVDLKIGVSNLTGGAGWYFVNAKSKNPEAAIKILDLFDATCYQSTDPNNFKTYYTDNQKNFCPIQVVMPNELYAPKIFAALQSGDSSTLNGMELPFYNYVVNFAKGTDTTPAAYGTWGQESLTGSLFYGLQAKANRQTVEDIMGSTKPQAFLDNFDGATSVLQTLINTDFTAIINGSASLDSYDTFVKDFLANGGQQILDQLDQLYPPTSK